MKSKNIDTSKKKDGPKVRETKEEKKKALEEKKEKVKKDSRLNRRKTLELDNKMNSTVKVPKDPRAKEAQKRANEAIESFIKKDIIEGMITKAHAQGESMLVCKEIQKNFENREVSKFVFPVETEFQFGVTGVHPKSLQAMSQFG